MSFPSNYKLSTDIGGFGCQQALCKFDYGPYIEVHPSEIMGSNPHSGGKGASGGAEELFFRRHNCRRHAPHLRLEIK